MVNLTPTVARIVQNKATTAFGEVGICVLDSGERAALIRVGLPAEIPPDAVITSAVLEVWQYVNASGSRTLTLRRNLASWAVGRVTWANAPTYTSTGQVSLTKASPPSGTIWRFDVGAHVQAWVSGAAKNYGWRLATSESATISLRGSKVASMTPRLVVEWIEPGDAPEELTPTGGQAVSVSHLTLAFTAAPGTTALQVQLSSSTDFTTPDFDSGEVPAFVGELALAETAYTGTAPDATIYWRARTKDVSDWTPWSEAAEYVRLVKAPLAITSPGATSDDSTPPIEWSFGGAQWAWQVLVRNSKGALVADSGRSLGADTIWTPPKAVAKEGDHATIEVRVWDDVDRVATPGDPAYTATTSTFTLSASAGIAGADTASATSDGVSPGVHLAATRASVPDGWVVVRDGVRIFRSDDPSSTFEWTDWTADPYVTHTYRIAPVVNGQVSAGGPEPTVTPRCKGVWLIDPETGTKAVIWDAEEGSWSAEELAVIHQPVAGPPVRRVAYRPPMSGSISGTVLDDVLGYSAADTEAALWEFKSSTQLDLRFVAGYLNIPVHAGDILVRPTPMADTDRWGVASWVWWQTGEMPWSP